MEHICECNNIIMEDVSDEFDSSLNRTTHWCSICDKIEYSFNEDEEIDSVKDEFLRNFLEDVLENLRQNNVKTATNLIKNYLNSL